MDCPGYLYAKTLKEDDRQHAVEYQEWFLHDDLTPFKSCIMQISEAFHFTATAGTVLAFVETSAGKGLLCRFRRMPYGDTKGRLHNRVEVMLVDGAVLPRLLNGGFKAIPNESGKSFDVDPVVGDALPQCGGHAFSGIGFKVWGPAEAFYFSKGSSSGWQESKETEKDVASDEVSAEKGGWLVRFALVLTVAALLVAGGYIYFQGCRIKELDRDILFLKDRLAERESQIRRMSEQDKKWERIGKRVGDLQAAFKNLRDNVSAVELLLELPQTDKQKPIGSQMPTPPRNAIEKKKEANGQVQDKKK